MSSKDKKSGLRDVMNQFWTSFPSPALLLMLPRVVHYEAQCQPVGEHRRCRHRSDMDCPNGERLRLFIGMHVPVKLSQEDLLRLAVLAQNGYIPDPYSGHCKVASIDLNLLNKKTTQFKVPTVVSILYPHIVAFTQTSCILYSVPGP